MKRKLSHFEEKESPLEDTLRKFRLKRITSQIPKNSIVLDAGCGYQGYLLQNVEKNIKKGVGIDISVAKIKNKKITLISGDLNKSLPFKISEFDAVISMANLEHLNSPWNTLKEFYRVLKPKGKLIITTPSTYNKPILEFLAFKLHLISSEEIADHKYYYIKDTLRKDLINAGFNEKNINIQYFQLGLNIFAIATK